MTMVVYAHETTEYFRELVVTETFVVFTGECYAFIGA